MTQATVRTTASTSAVTTWQMWVPCLGMALCSWLSFVDRQVLNILAPTIIKDTALTPQDFTTATSFFFLTYTLGNPVWGSVLDRVGLRIGMLLAVGVWTAASMSHALMYSFAGFALARAVLARVEEAHRPRHRSRRAHAGCFRRNSRGRLGGWCNAHGQPARNR